MSLPPGIGELLERRNAAFGSSEVTDIYTEDAVIIDDAEGSVWVRGRDRAHQFLSIFRANRRLVPSDFALGEEIGYIAGPVLRTDGSHSENFLLALKRGSDGKWRIAAENLSSIRPPEFTEPVTAESLIEQMDDAGVERGVVLSIAYWYGSPRAKGIENEYEKVKAENNWNVEQVSRFPHRLVAFCGVNPLKDYALDELRRCRALPNVVGMKLHFANSGVDLKNADHLRKVREFFSAANDQNMAILAHTWIPDRTYGREHSQIFLENVLPAAPAIAVQIAHLAGAGISCRPDDAVEVFAEAIQAGDPRTKNLYFDVTQCVGVDAGQSGETLALLAKRIRQIGLDRIFIGSDTATDTNPPIGVWWAAFRRRMPLTVEELREIGDNVPPYMR